ncbi:MAG: hypothetical protein WA792_04265, partial [Pseudolabrys sp.]
FGTSLPSVAAEPLIPAPVVMRPVLGDGYEGTNLRLCLASAAALRRCHAHDTGGQELFHLPAPRSPC